MLIAVVVCFIIGYLFIVFEQPLRLDKTVPALMMGAICWTLISWGHLPVVNEIDTIISYNNGSEAYHDGLTRVLLAHLSKIAEILLFLLGAMTIVELIDLHQGFSVITNRITTRNKKRLLTLLCIITFFLSAILDNLTTTIVMISLVRKLVPNQNDRLWFASLVVIAANAGGVWSPIGDVTTTMLWIGKKVSTGALIKNLYFPAIISLLLPLTLVLIRKDFRGNFAPIKAADKDGLLSSRTLFFAGFGALLFVPIFKTITHLPPFMGMLLSLGFTWLISEYVHPEENFQQENRRLYSVRRALSRIELSSILFFAGILLTITSLESIAVFHPDGKAVSFLHQVAENLQMAIPSEEIVVILIGLLSAIIDNVPLVAAVMGMYTEPIDAELWHFIAFSAGTGGSILIIGSAAGVAAMGLEKIDFIWYFRRIAWLALLGFLAGCLTFIGWFALIN